jgi:hypothetical protein
MMRWSAEILCEKAQFQQNTVNDGLQAVQRGRRAGRPGSRRNSDLWRIPEPASAFSLWAAFHLA